MNGIMLLVGDPMSGEWSGGETHSGGGGIIRSDEDEELASWTNCSHCSTLPPELEPGPEPEDFPDCSLDTTRGAVRASKYFAPAPLPSLPPLAPSAQPHILSAAQSPSTPPTPMPARDGEQGPPLDVATAFCGALVSFLAGGCAWTVCGSVMEVATTVATWALTLASAVCAAQGARRVSPFAASVVTRVAIIVHLVATIVASVVAVAVVPRGPRAFCFVMWRAEACSPASYAGGLLVLRVAGVAGAATCGVLGLGRVAWRAGRARKAKRSEAKAEGGRRKAEG